jgi:hypothetical protein
MEVLGTRARHVVAEEQGLGKWKAQDQQEEGGNS